MLSDKGPYRAILLMGGTMAAPYLFYDPENPPPRKWAVLILVAGIVVVIFMVTRDHVEKSSSSPQTDDQPTLTAAGPTSKEIMQTVKALRTGKPVLVSEARGTVKIREGFTITQYGWCSIDYHSKSRAVLEVSFTTDGHGLGFALAGATPPTKYIVPTVDLDGVGVVGFDDPTMNRLYVARTVAPNNGNNGWEVLGTVNLFGPITADWCGYTGVFHITHPGGFVEGLVHVRVYDPHDLLLR